MVQLPLIHAWTHHDSCVNQAWLKFMICTVIIMCYHVGEFEIHGLPLDIWERTVDIHVVQCMGQCTSQKWINRNQTLAQAHRWNNTPLIKVEHRVSGQWQPQWQDSGEDRTKTEKKTHGKGNKMTPWWDFETKAYENKRLISLWNSNNTYILSIK